MSLEVALVIKGDPSSAKKAIADTKTDLEGLGTAATKASAPVGEAAAAAGKLSTNAAGASQPVKDLATGLGDTATKAGEAKTAVGEVGDAAATAGGKFSGFQAAALGAIGGIAGAVVSAGIDLAFQTVLGAVTDYFDEVTNSAKNIEDDLEAHKDLIASIKGQWAEAEGAASSYGLVSQTGLRFEAEQNVSRLAPDLESELGRVGGAIPDASAFASSFRNGRLEQSPLAPVMAAIREDLADGRADIIAWRDEVVRIAAETPLGSSERSLAEQFLGDTQQAAELQAELQRAVDIAKALGGDAAAAATALGQTAAEMIAAGEAAGAAIPNLAEYDRLLLSIGQRGSTQDAIGPGVVGGFDRVTAFANNGVAGSFAEGGYTGPGGKYEPAGVAHRGEVIWSQDDVQRHGGPDVVDAMRRGLRGYAAGGVVGGPVGGGAFNLGGGALGLIQQSDQLGAVFAELGGIAKLFASDLSRTGDVLGAFQNVALSLTSQFLNAAGSAFDTAFPAAGGIGGTLASVISSLFGGGRAGGGSVSAGRIYEINESGREFFAPGVDGAVLPAGSVGGGGSFAGGGRPQLHVNVIGAPSTPQVRQKPDGDVDVIFAEFDRRLASGRFDQSMSGRYGTRPRTVRPG